MSLFDDILPQNKPNPPVQDDPLAITPQITITASTPMNIGGSEAPTPITPIESIATPTNTIPSEPSIIITETSTPPAPPILPGTTPLSTPLVSLGDPIPEASAIMTETPPIVPVSPIIPIIENQAPIENTPPTGGVTPVSELFSFGTDTSVSPPVSTPIDTPVSPIYPVSEVSDSADLSAITNDLSSAKTDLQPTPPTFQTTEDLIAHEISDLDEFILSLDEVDRAKLEQEAEYKKQKEHFAELEIEAESEHQKVLAERAHAEKMKSYLEAEIQGEDTKKSNIKKSSKSLV